MTAASPTTASTKTLCEGTGQRKTTASSSRQGCLFVVQQPKKLPVQKESKFLRWESCKGDTEPVQQGS